MRRNMEILVGTSTPQPAPKVNVPVDEIIKKANS